jgi:predicted HicB family RNase H-like nuclease
MKTLTTNINLKIQPALVEQLQAQAKQNERSLSAEVRMAIQAWLAK